MSALTVLIIVVVGLAILFDYINGFHDTANSIATVVSTRVLSPAAAIAMATALNFAGALISVQVATTIGKDLVDPHAMTLTVQASGLLAAIAWNLVTWYFGIPSSSSHALVGGLLGAALTAQGFGVVNMQGLQKVLLAFVTSPLAGLIAGFSVMLLIYWFLRSASPTAVERVFSRLQVASAALMAFSHGSNDAQKSMGIIAGALVTGGFLGRFEVPLWVKVTAALAMALGTSVGGWRIIRTMGHRLIRLRPVHGFAAESAAAGVIMLASSIGLPVSTTHVISSTILGVGASQRIKAVRWAVARNIGWAMLFTLPATAALAGIVYQLVGLVD